MKNKLLAVLAVAVGLFVITRPMFAHHSASYYDTENTTTFTGTVTDFGWANPHVQIHLDVKDDEGNVEKWIVESAPPNMLHRAGWNKDTVKPGDQITVSGHRAKDGSKIMSVRKIVLSNGQELNQRLN